MGRVRLLELRREKGAGVRTGAPNHHAEPAENRKPSAKLNVCNAQNNFYHTVTLCGFPPPDRTLATNAEHQASSALVLSPKCRCD
eukprot:3139742-Rhodomonas_salina.2